MARGSISCVKAQIVAACYLRAHPPYIKNNSLLPTGPPSTPPQGACLLVVLLVKNKDTKKPQARKGLGSVLIFIQTKFV